MGTKSLAKQQDSNAVVGMFLFDGPVYDLPIVLAVLLSSGQAPGIPAFPIYLGELSLNGGLRHNNGILPVVAVAREEGIETVFVPSADSSVAVLVEGTDVVPVNSLAEPVAHIRGNEPIGPATGDNGRSVDVEQGPLQPARRSRVGSTFPTSTAKSTPARSGGRGRGRA